MSSNPVSTMRLPVTYDITETWHSASKCVTEVSDFEIWPSPTSRSSLDTACRHAVFRLYKGIVNAIEKQGKRPKLTMVLSTEKPASMASVLVWKPIITQRYSYLISGMIRETHYSCASHKTDDYLPVGVQIHVETWMGTNGEAPEVLYSWIEEE